MESAMLFGFVKRLILVIRFFDYNVAATLPLRAKGSQVFLSGGKMGS